MTPDQLAQRIAIGREQGGTEFKSAGRCDDKDLFHKVVRAAMAMANRRGGGQVILGVEEMSQGSLKVTGLSGEQLATWKHDHVADRLRTYADPPIDFETLTLEHDGRKVVILDVREFSETPILCSKDAQDDRNRPVLKRGACYVRPRHKPESVEVGTSADMRDLLDLATAKRVRHLRSLANLGGLEITPLPTDTQQSDAETGEAAPAVAEIIRGRGYWQLSIRPLDYSRDRISSLTTAAELVRRGVVRHAGTEFPVLEHAEMYERHIEAASDSRQEKQFWRLFRSGLFVCETTLWEDWQDERILVAPPGELKPGQVLSVTGVLYRLYERFEFAAALSETEAGGSQMLVTAKVGRLAGRMLDFELPGLWFRTPFRTQAPSFTFSQAYQRRDLVDKSRAEGLAAARQLLDVFGCQPEGRMLEELWDRHIRDG